MPTPASVTDFLGLVRKSGLLDEPGLGQLADLDLPDEPFACAEALVRAHMLTPFQAKQLLAGRHRGLVLGAYKILRPLGKGGMGVVYLADHASLGRKVAIKVLTQDQARENLALERFYREARAAAALDHPNIVRLHDITQVAGIHFLVMEYVDGVDLQSLLQQTGALHYAQAANYIAQAAAGLQHAHERGFIHRDIKPANLILAKDGVVKILDMGLARSLANPKDALTGKLDDDDVITGTADYLSPEQALNVTLDARSDIYSLGATFFTLLTARPPFNGSTAQKLAQHQVAPPPNLNKLRNTIPPELNEVILRMMAKKPGERFQSVEEVLEGLSPWMPNSTVAPTTVTMRKADTGKSTKKTKRKKVKEVPPPSAFAKFIQTRNGKLAASGIGLVLLAGLAYAIFGGSSKKTETANNNPSNSSGGNSAISPPPVNPPKRTGATPVSPGAIVRLEASKVPPFRMVRETELIREGTVPTLPPGWLCEVWNKDATGEFRSETFDGRQALRVSALSGTNAAQFVFRPSDIPNSNVTPNQSYTIKVDYQTDAGLEGYLHVQDRTNYTILNRLVLKHQDSGWSTTTGTVKTDGKEFQITIGSTRTAPGKFISISRIELIPEGAASSERLLYTIDLSKLQPFKFRYQDGQPSDQDWRNKVPNGLYLHCWKKESVAEFRSDTADGRSSIGVVNFNDDNSSQILFQFDEGSNLPLQSGVNYRVRLEYRALNDAEGRADVRNPKNNDYSSIATTNLEATDGKWKTVDLTFRRPPDGRIDVCIINNAVGEGNVLSIRSLQVFEVGR